MTCASDRKNKNIHYIRVKVGGQEELAKNCQVSTPIVIATISTQELQEDDVIHVFLLNTLVQ